VIGGCKIKISFYIFRAITSNESYVYARTKKHLKRVIEESNFGRSGWFLISRPEYLCESSQM
jgi:hypothetical protein